MLRRALIVLLLIALVAVVGALLLLLPSDRGDEDRGPARAALVQADANVAASSGDRAARRRVAPSADEVHLDEAPEMGPAPAPEDQGGLIVRVTESGGAPVAGARVLMSGWGAQIGGSRTYPRELASGRTDDAGVSRLAPDLPATFVVLARDERRAGWASGTAQRSPFPRELDIVLESARRLEGIVTDQLGEPMSDVRVSATFRDKRHSPYCYLEVATSGADGRYGFDPIPEDLRSGCVDLHTSETADTIATSRTIRGAQDDETWTVRAIRTASLSARITMPDGSAAAGAQLHVRLVEGKGAAELPTDDDGRVTGRVPIGRVVVSALGPRGPSHLWREHSREVVIGEDGIELGIMILEDRESETLRDRIERARQGR